MAPMVGLGLSFFQKPFKEIILFTHTIHNIPVWVWALLATLILLSLYELFSGFFAGRALRLWQLALPVAAH
jgi:hypothetical protein